MASTSDIKNVAIIGAGGRIGTAFTEQLLKTGKHTVTALTRTGSKSKLPEGVKVAEFTYDDIETLVTALKGQDFLVITLAATAPPGTHTTLVKAAIKAGVRYIMPNAYGYDIDNEEFRQDPIFGARSWKNASEIEQLGGTYVTLSCGFWFEWSLAIGELGFGIDILKRTVTFFDDGKTVMDVSTWDQCGRVLAGLLSLPESGASPSVSDWKNKPVYMNSWAVTQRDMLDSVHRALGTTDKDWEIKYETSAERHKDGMGKMQSGDQSGFAKALYARAFFPNSFGNHSSKHQLANSQVGAPKEDLDAITKKVVEMVQSGWNPLIN